MANKTPTATEVRITVARLLELAYRQDDGLTTALVREAGNVTLSVDHRGNASLSGNAGRVSFSGDRALREIGVDSGTVQVLLSVNEHGHVRYNAQLRAGFATIGAVGSIDIDGLITACSGPLCHVARLLQGRSAEVDRAVRRSVEVRP